MCHKVCFLARMKQSRLLILIPFTKEEVVQLIRVLERDAFFVVHTLSHTVQLSEPWVTAELSIIRLGVHDSSVRLRTHHNERASKRVKDPSWCCCCFDNDLDTDMIDPSPNKRAQQAHVPKRVHTYMLRNGGARDVRE